MRAHWAYFQYVMRHKWHVFVGCLRLGVPLHQAIIHGGSSSCRSNGMRMCSSFTIQTARSAGAAGRQLRFIFAWLHHQRQPPPLAGVGEHWRW